ncbi:potassium-transporting ATPase subunit F [Polymorphobacter fuscus]|nr:potassium-transporting ATPase subunit F [Polymorphobacter fuscus]NJC08779.1 hypothetical protein [Polymorphobacter fuscus]
MARLIQKANTMTFDTSLGAIVAAAILLYLLAVLARPDRF